MISTSLLSLSLAMLPTAFAAVHDVQVGANGLTFEPEAIFAEPGDQVVFHFNPKNHTVTQSSFADPCGIADGGFNSGFMPVNDSNIEAPPTVMVDVHDKTPLWFNCQQGGKTAMSHCGQGMVFAINCGADGEPNSFSNFKAAALALGAQWASSSAAPAPSATYGGGEAPPAEHTWTAAYGGYTIPPPPETVTVTQTVTLEAAHETWTTTYASYPGSPDPTPASAEGNIIRVKVGDGALVFDPPRVDAKPRDTIVFEFHAKNHTVTQSSFDDPCRPLSANGTTGFDSGFMPVDASLTEGFPTWNFTVSETAPMWAYCRQATHCAQGMVFAINSNEESPRNFSAFADLAAVMGTSLPATAPTGSAASPEASGDAGDGALSLSAGSLGFTAVFAVAAFWVL